MTKNRKIAYLAGIATAIIWGAAFPVVKPALSLITPFQFLYFRFLLASILMLPLIFYHLYKKSFPFHRLGKIIYLESLSMLTLAVIYVGLDHAQALQASFIFNTKPIFMTIAGIMFLREKEERHELIGLILSVIGTGMVVAAPFIFGSSSSEAGVSYWGNSLIILAVFLEVYRLIKVKQQYNGIDKFLIIAISSVIGAVMFGFYNFITGAMPPLEVLTYQPVWLAVGYMGSIGSVIAFSLFLISYSRIEASEAALFEYLNPLVYIPLSVFWLKEALIPAQLVGVVIIAIGVFIAERRHKKVRGPKIPSAIMPATPALIRAKS